LANNRAKRRIIELMRTLVVPDDMLTNKHTDNNNKKGYDPTSNGPPNNGDTSDDQGRVRVLLRFLCAPESLVVDKSPLPRLPIPHPRVMTHSTSAATPQNKNNSHVDKPTSTSHDVDISPLPLSSCGAAVYSLVQSCKLHKVVFRRNQLQYHHVDGQCTTRPLTAEEVQQKGSGWERETEQMSTDLMFTSVGYRSVPIAGVPFDVVKHRIPNEKGRIIQYNTGSIEDDKEMMTIEHMDGGMRVLSRTLNELLDETQNNIYSQSQKIPTSAAADEYDNENTYQNEEKTMKKEDDHYAGLYVVGWLKRGPSGTIATSVSDAKETATMVVKDLLSMEEDAEKPSGDEEEEEEEEERPLESLLHAHGAKVTPWVDWSTWQKINEREIAAGSARSPQKPRVKVLSRKAMIT
jgi:hypothetical protein